MVRVRNKYAETFTKNAQKWKNLGLRIINKYPIIEILQKCTGMQIQLDSWAGCDRKEVMARLHHSWPFHMKYIDCQDTWPPPQYPRVSWYEGMP